MLDNFNAFFVLIAVDQELSSSTDGNNDIVAYIQLQKSIADAKKYDLSAARATLAFWEVLQGNQPDLSRMNELSTQINKSMGQAYEAFRLLMRLNANSISVLRMYAGFLLDLANEPEQARLMLTRADELEDQQSKDHHESGLDMTTLDDRHAIVSISAELKTLGTIIQGVFESSRVCFAWAVLLIFTALLFFDLSSECDCFAPAWLLQDRARRSQHHGDCAVAVFDAPPVVPEALHGHWRLDRPQHVPLCVCAAQVGFSDSASAICSRGIERGGARISGRAQGKRESVSYCAHRSELQCDELHGRTRGDVWSAA